MTITHNIRIDLVRPEILPPVKVVQGDTCTRDVKISLYAAGEALELPEGHDVAIRYGKPDGTSGIYDTLPDNSVAWTSEGNTVSVTLCPQMLTCPGKVPTQVSIIVGDRIISTFAFLVLVEADPSKGAMKSENYNNWRKAFIPQTDGARVGQYLQIAEVDADGRTIAVAAVDDPAADAKTYANTAVDRANAAALSAESAKQAADIALGQAEQAIEALQKVSDAKDIADEAQSTADRALEVAEDVEQRVQRVEDDQRDLGDAIAIMRGTAGISVKAYHAVGDGKIDDTAAFQSALAANRCVYVPGGTYKLSNALVIAENCRLELSQDTVLQFTQTEGNCFELRGSATLWGNHAIISVPYAFIGNVISIDTALDGEAHNSIPPYTKADPMWKRQRFIYDVNIIKTNEAGFNRSDDGKCNGIAIYLSADGTASIPWMWAITMSGVRIAGGFSYGIRAVNYDDLNGYTDNAWNHDMRIEAVIEGCEIGVALENCNGAHLKVTVQPNVATGNNAAYAKHGVYLNDSRFVDMIGSRVWDWNDKNSLWTEGGEYQHIALIGNCRGLLLDDFLCHEGSAEIRTLIYTDTPANFDTMSILQEPGNKHFKAKDGVPYFHDGTNDRKLMLATEKFTAEQAEFIHPADGYYTYTPNFTNLVSNYQDGYYEAGGSLVALAGYTTTDFIPIDGGDTHVYRIGGEGISWSDDYCYCRIAWYDSSKALKGSVMSWEKIGSSIYYPTRVEDENAAFAFATNANVAPPNGAAYFRITAKGSGANLKVTIDEPFDYTAIWHGEPKKLDDSIHAKNDWNAAEGEVGHVLNRTHYAEFTESGVIFPESTVVWNADTEYAGIMELSAPLVIGNTYKVVCDGKEYTTRAVSYEGMPAIGNTSILATGYEDTGEPFAIVYSEGSALFVPESITSEEPTEGSATVKIIEETVHKLDGKYIPARSYIITDVTDSTINESFDNFSDILWNGGTVYVRRQDSSGGYMLTMITSASWANGGWLLHGYEADEAIFFYATNGTWTP